MENREAGQAAVEASLTLPLVVFLVLGTLQLFMMMQARIIAQYAVYKATRTGSLMHGDCQAMTHTAIATLLPTITRTDSPDRLANAFGARRGNRYNDGGHLGQIVEIFRESPLAASLLPAIEEDNRFDQPNQLERLDVRMIYWYRMKIPFADWVMSKMFLAHYGLQAYRDTNPTLLTERNANWPDTPPVSFAAESWPGGELGANMLGWSNSGHYLFPLRVTSSMRMMTPPRKANFADQGCPL